MYQVIWIVCFHQDGKTIVIRTPLWLKRTCARLLCDIIVNPMGVQNVLRGLLQTPSAAGNSPPSFDWKHCDAVAKVIAHCPHHGLSSEDYMKAVAPQVSACNA